MATLLCPSVEARPPSVLLQHRAPFWWLGTTAALELVSPRGDKYSNPWAHLYPGEENTGSWETFTALSSEYVTHHFIAVVQLQNHVWRVAHDSLWVAMDFNVVEDESLIPGGVQRGAYDFGGLTQVEEWHMDVRIWNRQSYYREWMVRQDVWCLDVISSFNILFGWFMLYLRVLTTWAFYLLILTWETVLVHCTEIPCLVYVDSQLVSVRPWRDEGVISNYKFITSTNNISVQDTWHTAD